MKSKWHRETQLRVDYENSKKVFRMVLNTQHKLNRIKMTIHWIWINANVFSLANDQQNKTTMDNLLKNHRHKNLIERIDWRSHKPTANVGNVHCTSAPKPNRMRISSTQQHKYILIVGHKHKTHKTCKAHRLSANQLKINVNKRRLSIYLSGTRELLLAKLQSARYKCHILIILVKLRSAIIIN